MPALFDSEWDGQDNSNYGWSAVTIYEANGTETGQSCGLDVGTSGDAVVPDADVPRLIAALQAYAAAQGLAPAAATSEEDLVQALTGFRVTVLGPSATPWTGEITEVQAVADALHAGLSRIRAERSPDQS